MGGRVILGKDGLGHGADKINPIRNVKLLCEALQCAPFRTIASDDKSIVG